MKKKRRGRMWLWLLFILIAAALVLGAYYMGMKKGSSQQETTVDETVAAPQDKTPKRDEIQTETPAEEETPTEQDRTVRVAIESRPVKPEDMCKRLEKDVREFFGYLDERNSIQHLEDGISTYDRFRKMIGKLSSRPPIPAGEGIDSMTMIKNIYHIFRVLGKNDLRLIKEVLRNEAGTLEMNIDLFYRWLMLGDRCPDPEGIRPSMQVIYQYAGFFLNTIGGRSYLFRRPLPLRLLVSYYCLQIIHKADKEGLNSYGLDILPDLASLQHEMALHTEFLFHNEYVGRLEDMSNYYLERR